MRTTTNTSRGSLGQVSRCPMLKRRAADRVSNRVASVMFFYAKVGWFKKYPIVANVFFLFATYNQNCIQYNTVSQKQSVSADTVWKIDYKVDNMCVWERHNDHVSQAENTGRTERTKLSTGSQMCLFYDFYYNYLGLISVQWSEGDTNILFYIFILSGLVRWILEN